jgi:hypothetical protein
MSRLVFATPRVRNLLGLRNLEIRDLEKSSLDAVRLGQPHPLFLPNGIIQVQSLYEGSRGPGAARLLGVTTFLNGRAGLGPSIESAARQALNDPPAIDVLAPREPGVVGEPFQVGFRVRNARRETVTIVTPGGRGTRRLAVVDGLGTVTLVPSQAGRASVRVRVVGQDGTVKVDRTAFRVLSAPPAIRLVSPPTRAVAGEPVRLVFRVRNAVREAAEVSTRSGIVFSRLYRIRDGTGVLTWTPRTAGRAVVVVRVVGRQGQAARELARIDVAPPPETPPVPPVPSVALLDVPRTATVGVRSEVAFRAEDCRAATARIEGPDEEVEVWRFGCPAARATFTWTPAAPGRYRLTTTARGGGTTVQASTRLRAGRP